MYYTRRVVVTYPSAVNTRACTSCRVRAAGSTRRPLVSAPLRRQSDARTTHLHARRARARVPDLFFSPEFFQFFFSLCPQATTASSTLTSVCRTRAKTMELVWISPMDSRANARPDTPVCAIFVIYTRVHVVIVVLYVYATTG